MKRSIKNLIMTIIMLLICGSMIFTMNYPKNHVASSTNSNATSMQNGNPPSMNSNVKTSISYIYYIIFAFQGFLFPALLIYFIISKFNKKTFKQTFSSSKKSLIIILAIIVLTTALTYSNRFITNKLFLSTKNNEQNKNFNNNQSDSSISYSANSKITDEGTITSGSYDSTPADENALLIDGENDVNISNINVTKTGDSDGADNTSFYGINSGLLAKGGTNLILKNINVTTNATGANGVFCYGGSATTNNSSSDETAVTISNSTITTTKDNSGGIMTTGGGIMKASNLTINTAGTSSAAIRTDRGGGTVTVDGGTYTTTGQGSPTIYSTADVSVSNASLIANASEGIVIDGYKLYVNGKAIN